MGKGMPYVHGRRRLLGKCLLCAYFFPSLSSFIPHPPSIASKNSFFVNRRLNCVATVLWLPLLSRQQRSMLADCPTRAWRAGWLVLVPIRCANPACCGQISAAQCRRDAIPRVRPGTEWQGSVQAKKGVMCASGTECESPVWMAPRSGRPSLVYILTSVEVGAFLHHIRGSFIHAHTHRIDAFTVRRPVQTFQRVIVSEGTKKRSRKRWWGRGEKEAVPYSSSSLMGTSFSPIPLSGVGMRSPFRWEQHRHFAIHSQSQLCAHTAI